MRRKNEELTNHLKEAYKNGGSNTQQQVALAAEAEKVRQQVLEAALAESKSLRVEAQVLTTELARVRQELSVSRVALIQQQQMSESTLVESQRHAAEEIKGLGAAYRQLEVRRTDCSFYLLVYFLSRGV